MKLLKRALIGLGALLGLLVAIGLLLPSHARVQRSIVIERPAADVFVVINSFARFNEWSPWFDIDPNAVYTYAGSVSGVGASMTWKGNPSVGTGTQVITESETNVRTVISLSFEDMPASRVEMHLNPQDQGTLVTWTMDSDLGYNPISRYFGLLMDRFVGPDYEKGLAQLKVLMEKQASAN